MPKSAVAQGGDAPRFTSRSFTVLPGGKSWPTCKACGSTIPPSRRKGSKVRTIGGSRLNVDKYRCRCGKGFEVRRPWEDAQAA